MEHAPDEKNNPGHASDEIVDLDCDLDLEIVDLDCDLDLEIVDLLTLGNKQKRQVLIFDDRKMNLLSLNQHLNIQYLSYLLL